MSDSLAMKSEKVLRQRLQRVQQRTGEHSVSSQTLSPIHSECRDDGDDGDVQLVIERVSLIYTIKCS